MRLYIEGCLQAMGPVRVVQAATGHAALHLARAISPALVIAEHLLPGLSGPALYRALSADPQTRGIPVLIIGDEAPPAPEAGDGFLATPFNAARLQAAVERLLGQPLAPRSQLP